MTQRLFGLLGALLLATACGGSTQSTPAPVTPAEPAAAAPAEPEKPAEAEPDTLTEAQCGEAVDHNIALMKADPEEKGFAASMEKDKAKFVADCVAKWGK